VKRVIIFTFSGTGHTEIVAGMLRDALRAQGVHVDCRRIDRCVSEGAVPDLAGYDAVGIGYPIYAFNAPRTVESFARMLPKAAGKPVFVLKTAGESFVFNSTSSYGIHWLLMRKGYDLRYERLFLMPYNIVFRYPDGVVKQIYTLSKRLAGKMAADIIHGVANRPRYNPLLLLVSLILRIQMPGARLNGRLMRAGKGCSGCGQCARECPAGNIRIDDGRVRFGWNCVMCMRCVMYCPRGAVKAGLLERWAVRGGYDFERILTDPAVADRYIEHCEKGFFRYFKRYVRETEKLIGEDRQEMKRSMG
jgi:flavodoxin/ferredoxin